MIFTPGADDVLLLAEDTTATARTGGPVEEAVVETFIAGD